MIFVVYYRLGAAPSCPPHYRHGFLVLDSPARRKCLDTLACSPLAPAHAALLELLAAAARTGIVPAHLLLAAEKRCRLPFQKIVPLFRWNSLRWQSGFRHGLEETPHLLHATLLVGQPL